MHLPIKQIQNIYQRKEHLVIVNQLQDSLLVFSDWSKLELCFCLWQPITNYLHSVVKFLRLDTDARELCSARAQQLPTSVCLSVL